MSADFDERKGKSVFRLHQEKIILFLMCEFSSPIMNASRGVKLAAKFATIPRPRERDVQSSLPLLKLLVSLQYNQWFLLLLPTPLEKTFIQFSFVEIKQDSHGNFPKRSYLYNYGAHRNKPSQRPLSVKRTLLDLLNYKYDAICFSNVLKGMICGVKAFNFEIWNVEMFMSPFMFLP